MVALDANGGAATLASGTSSALDVAQSAGIVIYASAGREVRFGHPLMAMAAVEMATARQRRDAHRALAAVVEDPVRRAWHRLRAALGPDEDAAAEIERAAEVALRRADVVGAVNLFTRSAELSPDHASKARRLIVAARVAGEVAGHLDEASTLIDTARTIGTDPVGSLSEAIAGARQLMNAGGAVDTARSLIARAIETHVRTEEFAAENDELIEALNVLCILAWEVGSDKGWQPILRFVERLATPVPELLSLTIGLLYDPARTATDHLPALDQAIARLGRDTDPLYTVLLVKATAYVDRVGDCRDALWRIVDNGRRGGAVACAMHALVQLCADAWMAGNWDDVSRLAAEVTSLGDAHGYRRYAWIVEGYFCAMVGVARGREDDSLRQAVRTAEWASARGSLCSQQFLQHVRALNALGNSDFASAFEAICSVFTPGRLPAGAPNSLWMLLDFTEAAQRSGHDDAALAHVRAMRESVLGQVSPRLAMVVAASTALIAETSLATDLFEEALHIPGAPRFPFDYARVHLLFGEHLRRARSMTRSRMHLEVAASLFDDLGAKPWQDRAAAELRATSARRPNSPGSVLTPQEREIALLAASGLSNKEIGQRLVVSPRTVGVHLYRVFPKLGISSRAALRDALKRAGIESSERRDGAPRGEAWLTP
jgi:DNA-binding CsgD family transcriptional regulator